MSTDSTDSTSNLGGTSRVGGDARPSPAPQGPGAPSAHQSAGADPRRRLVAVRSEVGKAVVGQDAAVTGLVIAMLAGGHVLLEGVPGVAKTLLVRCLATALDVETKRIQFTPDLMPGDVTGSLIYDSRSAQFSFRAGPVFTNLLLADEINRTPPKTQSALLEAMEERQVSVDGEPRALPDPFMVIATQNPVEYEGTYPLPEAQLDRFLLKLVLPLPERAQEIEVLSRHASGFDPRNLPSAGPSARNRDGPQDGLDDRLGGDALHLGLGAQLDAVTQGRQGQCLDVIGGDEGSARQPRPGPRRRQERGGATRRDPQGHRRH